MGAAMQQTRLPNQSTRRSGALSRFITDSSVEHFLYTYSALSRARLFS